MASQIKIEIDSIDLQLAKERLVELQNTIEKINELLARSWVLRFFLGIKKVK